MACSALGLVIGLAYLLPALGHLTLGNAAWSVLLGLMAALSAWFCPRPQDRAAMGVLIAAISSAWLIAMALPLTRDKIPDVTITATGQKNPASKSAEVYVSLGAAAGSAFEGKHWEKRGDVFVSYEKQPSVLRFIGSHDAHPVLHIIQHPYSGIAEVSINGKVQRLDLYAEQQGEILVPLPDSRISWKSHARRIALAAGLGVMFAAAGMALLGASVPWASIMLLALLAGSSTLWLVKDRSYAGSLEIVAFDAPAGATRVELDTGHGITPELASPVNGGTTLTSDIPLQDADAWHLKASDGIVTPLRSLSDAQASDPNAFNQDCATLRQAPCIYEVKASSVAVQIGQTLHEIALPPGTEARKRFLLIETDGGHLRISASSAHFLLSSNEQTSQWVRAIRVTGNDGKPAGKLVRLMAEGNNYQVMAASAASDTYRVPEAVRPDTPSFVGMKLFAALISASVVLLLAIGAKTASSLSRTFQEGRRVQVLACLLGCLGWLGSGLIIAWPAFIGWDGFSPYIQAQSGAINLWYGLGYPLIVGGFLLLGPASLVTVWSTACTALVLLSACALLLRHGSARACWLAPILLCAILPCTAILVGATMHLRDAMNGLMLTMYGLGAFYAGLRWKTWAAPQRSVMAGLLLLASAILALLRIDNIPALLVISVLTLYSLYGLRLRALAQTALVVLLLAGINPVVERLVVPSRTSAATEKRLYKSSALINPLTGMLVFDKGQLGETLHNDLRDSLDKVLDVEVAMKQWSPYHVRYWHESLASRPIPTDEINHHLQELYVKAILADPVTFIKIRLETFSQILGFSTFLFPTEERLGRFSDHLLTKTGYWHRLSLIMGFPLTAHPYPESAQALLAWQDRSIGTLFQFIVCLILMMRFRRHPLASAIAIGELARAGIFFLLAPASVFLYLYDLHLLGLLLPMLALCEQKIRSNTRLPGAKSCY